MDVPPKLGVHLGVSCENIGGGLENTPQWSKSCEKSICYLLRKPKRRSIGRKCSSCISLALVTLTLFKGQDHPVADDPDR